MAVSANNDACVIGVDFGTLSGRALVVRVGALRQRTLGSPAVQR
jgi:hypothetical protein